MKRTSAQESISAPGCAPDQASVPDSAPVPVAASVSTPAPSSSRAARFIVPVLGALAALALGATLIYPMLAMDPRDVPMAILSLDEGAVIGGETVNVGDELIAQLTGADSDSSTNAEDSDGSAAAASSSSPYGADMIVWTVAESQEELDSLMESGACYASITIPANFSETNAALRAREALGDALVEKLPTLAQAATAIESGSSQLSEGASSLATGAASLSEGVSTLQSQVGALPTQAQTLADGASSLAQGLDQLDAGAASASAALASYTGLSSLQTALSQAQALYRLGGSENIARADAIMQQINAQIGALDATVSQIKTGVSQLSTGLSASSDGASALSMGLATFSASAPTLVSGVGSLASGAAQVSDGAASLSTGAAALASGAASNSEGVSAANDVLASLPSSDATASESEAEQASLEVLINQGKNPFVSNSLNSALSGLTASSGFTVETSYLNPLPEGMSMGFTHMALMILTYISSYASAVVLSRTFRFDRSSRAAMGKSLALQLGYMVCLALVVGVGVAGIMRFVYGDVFAFGDLALFVAIASLSFQVLTMGFLDWFGLAGMVVPVGILVVGMGAAYLPFEFLPTFWQNFIHPWDPLRFIVDGFKNILYMGTGYWNEATGVLCAIIAGSLAFFFANLLRRTKTR